jgi:hypothetical protein
MGLLTAFLMERCLYSLLIAYVLWGLVKVFYEPALMEDGQWADPDL